VHIINTSRGILAPDGVFVTAMKASAFNAQMPKSASASRYNGGPNIEADSAWLITCSFTEYLLF
jgi:hypothetical protein